MGNLPSNIEAVDPESAVKSDTLFIVDRLLEPQTIPHFFGFCGHGELPNGKQSALPRPSSDEIVLIASPYAEWATPPHNTIAESAIRHVMTRIGSYEDSGRLTVVEKSIHAMKSRLWEGLVPLSRNRWRAMELDDSKHFQAAYQHLGAVVSTFEYLNKSEQAANLRETFNLISEHLADFEAALNSRRSMKGDAPISMTALWEEFIRAHYQAMTTGAHAWVLSHINTLRQPILRELLVCKPTSEDQPSPEQWELTNKLHELTELAARADYTILVPMEGYTGYSKPAPGEYPELKSSDLATRRQAYSDRLKLLSRTKIFESMMTNPIPNEPPKGPANSESMVQTYNAQTEAQNELRIETRGMPDSMPPAGWISDIIRSRGESANPIGPRGFVAYRLSYRQSDEEWAAFLRKLEADLADWGDGIDGAEDIQASLKLQWLDGKELGIADGDVEAAKRHFKTHCESDAFTPGMNSEVFLAIDAPSIDSYTSSSPGADSSDPGENTGFVIAVDASFDPDEPNEHADESPGFTGELRILGSLVWSDLYAMLAAQTQGPAELWPLAMNHPRQVYVGPTVPEQIQRWNELNSLRSMMLGGFMQFLKDKKPGTEREQELVQGMMGPNGRSWGPNRDSNSRNSGLPDE